VRAAPGYERALAAALGDDLDAAVAGEGPRRWAGAEMRAGDPALPPGTDPLARHVTAPAALARRLAQVAVVEDDDGSAQLAVGQRLVTRGGLLRRWDGFVATGIGAAAADRLIRINRLSEIQTALPEAAEAVALAQALVEAAQREAQEARAAAEEARRVQSAAEVSIREAGREEDAAAIALERLGLRRSGLEERLAQAGADLADARGAMEQADAAVAALPEATTTDAEVSRLRQRAEAAQRALADVRRKPPLMPGGERRPSAGRDGAEGSGRLARACRRGRKKDRRHRPQDRRSGRGSGRLADAPQRLAEQVDRLEVDYRDAQGSADAAVAAEREAEAALRLREARLSDVTEALSVAREARAGAVARHENQESRRIEMGRIAGERFECPPPLLPQRLGFEESSIEPAGAESSALEKLSADRERIGPVNLVAEQELTELEEGRSASQKEREELGLAINRLRGSIGSLNREGRARLLAAFEAVDRHFRSLFTTLFEGGQAHLELVESDDPLEAGLEILAQPPGKRLSTLTLLSGGEQALTAIALIFALFSPIPRRSACWTKLMRRSTMPISSASATCWTA
jgi:chromosome segregation protein